MNLRPAMTGSTGEGITGILIEYRIYRLIHWIYKRIGYFAIKRRWWKVADFCFAKNIDRVMKRHYLGKKV